MDDQLTQYIPILILAAVAIGFATVVLIASVVVSRWTGTTPRTTAKGTPYECGMLPVGDGGVRLSVRFYLVAMLFILFDIEVVFLYPWAVVYKDLLASHANLIFGAMFSFLGILFIGYIYALKKRAFEWKN